MSATQRPQDAIGHAERYADGVFNWIARACGWVLVVMAFMITLDIVLRELRTMGIIGFNWQFVAEWSAYLVILLVFAGLAHTLRADGHITVNIFVDEFHQHRVLIVVVMAENQNILVDII